MNLAQLSAVVDGMAPVVRKFVADVFVPLEDRVKALERQATPSAVDAGARIESIETRITAIEAAGGNEVRSFADALIAKFTQATHV